LRRTAYFSVQKGLISKIHSVMKV